MTAGALVGWSPALEVYECGLLSGRGRLIIDGGAPAELPIGRWAGSLTDADQALLDRCSGPTLDVGCGPGRMTAALTSRGIPVLGVDVSAAAVAMAVARGALAVQRNIFHATPGAGRWRHVLLADGNIGIGGDPVRLLKRCADLLAVGGSVLADLAPPGAGMLVRQVRLQVDGRTSRRFLWGWLGVDAVAEHAARAGLAPVDVWCAGPRWQAELSIIGTRRPVRTDR